MVPTLAMMVDRYWIAAYVHTRVKRRATAVTAEVGALCPQGYVADPPIAERPR